PCAFRRRPRTCSRARSGRGTCASSSTRCSGWPRWRRGRKCGRRTCPATSDRSAARAAPRSGPPRGRAGPLDRCRAGDAHEPASARNAPRHRRYARAGSGAPGAVTAEVFARAHAARTVRPSPSGASPPAPYLVFGPALRPIIERSMLSFQILDGGDVFTWDLEGRPLLIGAAPDCDIRLQSPGVAAHHARVEPVRRDGVTAYKVVDLGSDVGTRVNGEAIAQVMLAVGDRIEIADATLVLGK